MIVGGTSRDRGGHETDVVSSEAPTYHRRIHLCFIAATLHGTIGTRPRPTMGFCRHEKRNCPHTVRANTAIHKLSKRNKGSLSSSLTLPSDATLASASILSPLDIPTPAATSPRRWSPDPGGIPPPPRSPRSQPWTPDRGRSFPPSIASASGRWSRGWSSPRAWRRPRAWFRCVPPSDVAPPATPWVQPQPSMKELWR